MGTPLIQQRRGKGSPTYRAPSHRYFGEIKYLQFTEKAMRGEILDIVNSVGHSSPLILIKYANGAVSLLPAPMGIRQGDEVWIGKGAKQKIGSTMKLGEINSGTFVYNLEKKPLDGGQLVRTSGTAAQIVGKEEGKIIVKMPSKRTIAFSPDCRATIGIIAGLGRKDKPFIRGGKKHIALKARGKLHPHVCGVAMNAKDHPFGGTHRRTKGRPTTTSRHAPPGRKVGLIAARKTGRGK